MTCETCEGTGRVVDHSGNHPSIYGLVCGPVTNYMECPACDGKPDSGVQNDLSAWQCRDCGGPQRPGKPCQCARE